MGGIAHRGTRRDVHAITTVQYMIESLYLVQERAMVGIESRAFKGEWPGGGFRIKTANIDLVMLRDVPKKFTNFNLRFRGGRPFYLFMVPYFDDYLESFQYGSYFLI